jgi:hypothetical protein
MADTLTAKKKPGDPGYDPLVDGSDSNLMSGLQLGNQNYLDQAYKTIGSQVSGEAYNPYRTEANQALSRAASSLRSSVGGQLAPAVGQGSAVRAQQAVEQNILGNISAAQVGMAQGEQAMKNQGVQNLLNMRGQLQSEQAQRFGQEQTLKQTTQAQDWAAYEAAVKAGDFNTAQSKYRDLTGLNLDTAQLQKAQEVLNKQAEQAIAGTELAIGGEKYSQIQNMVNTGATLEQINAGIGAGQITPQQYESMKAASDTSFRMTQLTQNAALAEAGIASAEKIAGMNISSNKDIAQMQINSAEKLAADKNWLDQQNIDLNHASIYGYTDASGNHVPGSMEIAQKRFGLESDTLQLQKEEIKQKYALLNAEDKRAADAFYGYDSNDSEGNSIHHLGTSDLAAAELELKQQGLSLEEAQLKGYTDASGNHVAGNLETAAQSLGLQAKSVQGQLDEIYGYTNEAGEYVPGRLASLSMEQQNQAKQLYGYTDPQTGEHVMGTLELNQKNVIGTLENQRQQIQNSIRQTEATISIQERTMKIQEASAESETYWDTAKQVEAYAQTHLNLSPDDRQWQSLMSDWWEQQFGVPPDVASENFKNFAAAELKAAQDTRLTNPIDQGVYQINTSTQLTPDEKVKAIAVLKQLPENVTFSTDAEGNVVVDTGVNAFNPDVTYDSTNTYASHPAMFAEGGGVWVGEGQQQFLVNGQKITLDSNFGIQNSTRTIPKGNYTATMATLKTGIPVSLLQSEDGGKYYLTSYKVSANGVTTTGNNPNIEGYTYHSDGKYYTKD